VIQHLHASRQIWEQRPKPQKHRHERNKANPFCNTEADAFFGGQKGKHRGSTAPLPFEKWLPVPDAAEQKPAPRAGCLLPSACSTQQAMEKRTGEELPPATGLALWLWQNWYPPPLLRRQTTKPQLQCCSLVVCHTSGIRPQKNCKL